MGPPVPQPVEEQRQRRLEAAAAVPGGLREFEEGPVGAWLRPLWQQPHAAPHPRGGRGPGCHGSLLQLQAALLLPEAAARVRQQPSEPELQGVGHDPA